MFRLKGRILSIAAVVPLALSAQPFEDKSTEPARGFDRGDVQAVLSLARSVPAEFGADAMITLVEHGLIPDRRAARGILDEAFTLSGNAQEKIALKRGSGDSPVAAALHGAFHNGIDAASLRARVVEAMLRYDAHAARELFEKIDLPIPPAGSCEQQTIPDFTLYYVTMFEVAKTIGDRAQLEAFFMAHMARFQSSAQITPFARVFMQVPNVERMNAVMDAFADKLPNLALDRRVFSSTYDDAIEAVSQLLGDVSPAVRERLIQQSRAWVVRNANFGVCREAQHYAVAFDGAGRKAIPNIEPAERFNQDVAWRSKSPARIETAEIANHEKGVEAPSISNSSEYNSHFSFHLLLSRDGDGGLDLSRWRGEMTNYIDRLTSWTSSTANFYLEKADLLTHVLFIERHAPVSQSGPVKVNWYGAKKPEGPRVEIPGRDRVIGALVGLFDSETAQKIYNERRVIWFAPVRDLLALPGVADRYAASHHPVLALYGRLENLTGAR